MVAKASLGSEVNKLQKELETMRSRQGDGSQLTSLKDELEKLRAELQEAHAHRKKLEEEHSNEKMRFEQVSCQSLKRRRSFSFTLYVLQSPNVDRIKLSV